MNLESRINKMENKISPTIVKKSDKLANTARVIMEAYLKYHGKDEPPFKIIGRPKKDVIADLASLGPD